jgi:hypothetical protein
MMNEQLQGELLSVHENNQTYPGAPTDLDIQQTAETAGTADAMPPKDFFGQRTLHFAISITWSRRNKKTKYEERRAKYENSLPFALRSSYFALCIFWETVFHAR